MQRWKKLTDKEIERLASACDEKGNHKRCACQKKGRYPDLENALLVRRIIRVEKNLSRDRRWSKETAIELAKGMKIENFFASDGWIQNYLSRNNLKFKKMFIKFKKKILIFKRERIYELNYNMNNYFLLVSKNIFD